MCGIAGLPFQQVDKDVKSYFSDPSRSFQSLPMALDLSHPDEMPSKLF